MSRPGIVFVVSGPSGVGKTSILRRALESESSLQFSVSHTTRQPRESEAAGSHYHFVDESRTFRRHVGAVTAFTGQKSVIFHPHGVLCGASHIKGLPVGLSGQGSYLLLRNASTVR